MANKEALTPYGVLVLIFASIGGMLFGYHTAVISGALVFLSPLFQLTPTQEGIVVSITLLGGLLGAIIAGALANRWGRKKAMLVTAFLFIPGALMIASAHSFIHLFLGRFVSGIAAGIVSVVAPLYLAETAPPHCRGRWVSIFQLCITLGILFSFAMAFVFSGHEEWEMLFVTGAMLALFEFCIIFFIPETPSWLLNNGKAARAVQDLTRLRMDEAWKEEIEQMRKTAKPQYRWSDFLQPHMPYILFVGFVLSMLQQITGINAVIYYMPKIFHIAGVSSASSPFQAAIALTSINSVATCLSIWLLDKKGRRVLLLAGTVGMTVSLAVLCFGFFSHNSHMNILALASLIAYSACFAFSLGPVTWVVISEIFPLKIRGNALACALALNWLSNYVVSLLFPNMIAAWGGGISFAIFAVISLFAFVFVSFFVRETKGKSLEEIEALVTTGKF